MSTHPRASFPRPWLAALLLVMAPSVSAETVRLARDPAPAPDGRHVAFSWRGDIFLGPATGGPARRLTAHPAEDRQPAWSPDGKTLAFVSNRHGSWDVHVMAADGSNVRRLTHHSASDTDPSFDSDGKAVLFRSDRAVPFGQEATAWRVPADGSADPVRHLDFATGVVAASPGGRWLAFTRGRMAWWRRDYRGAGNVDCWVRSEESGATRQLTTHPGNDDSPSWVTVGGRAQVALRSDRDGTFNVWLVDPATGTHRQLTRFEGDGVTWPRAGGGLIAFTVLDRTWIVDVAGGDAREITFEAPGDTAEDAAESLTLSSDASDLALSADGDEMALVVRGEVVVARAEKEPRDPTAAVVTRSAGRDREPAWLPDGSGVVFTSDRDGRYDLYLARPRDGDQDGLARALAFDVERLTDAAADDVAPRVSPDGRHVAFRRGRGDLVVVDLQDRSERTLSPGWNLGQPRWSPDGRWLAFSRDDDEFNADIWVVPADGSAPPTNVSRHPDDDADPRWSANGRALAYRARRQGPEDRVALLFLREADAALAAAELEDEWKEAAKSKASEQDDDTAREPAPGPEVRIDFPGIHERTRLLAPMPGGGAVAPSPDGLSIAHVARGLDGETDLWSVSWDGSETTRLTRGGQQPSALHWSSDGKTITFLAQGGRVKRVGAGGGSVDSLPFRVRLDVDRRAERRQVFAEAWRLLDQEFYDGDFHGVEWPAMRDKYAPLAEGAVTRSEFHDVVRRMLGELNASHLGIWGGGSETAAETTGELGLLLDPPLPDGGHPIRHVVVDSPADLVEPPLSIGDVLVAIDDTRLTSESRIAALLANRTGERVRLSVRDGDSAASARHRDDPGSRAPAAAEPREVVLRPISPGALRDLLYEEWIQRRRDWTLGWSAGRVGYLHVRGMNVSSLERFEQELHSVGEGRQAIVIDVRNNGGGWTTDMMLAMLMVRPHAVTVPRGGGRGYPEDRRPLYAWTRPVVALCNQNSFSNAEIFSHAMKTLERGLLVGTPTHGSVISTGGTRLLDGSFFRLPFRGWYVAGSGLNMEGNGAVPDVLVEQGPADESAGDDPQLRRAVELLLGELGAGGG